MHRRDFLLGGAKAGLALLAWDALPLSSLAGVDQPAFSTTRFPLMINRPSDGEHLEPFVSLYRQGVRLFHIDATCAEDIYHPPLRAWTQAGTYDYAPQEAYWRALLAKCPEAKFCLRVYAGSPPWWDEAHPLELQRYSDGSVEHTFRGNKRRTLPSLASEEWRRDAARSLERFLGWLESSGWAEKVWGLFLCYGITWEWGILGSDDFPDYSQPMRRRFRRWLRDTYKSDEALRQSWGDPAVLLETAEIPTREARLRSDGDFRVFPRDRAAFDFQRCLSDVNADYLLLLAKTARAKAGKRYVLGAFYGYTLTAREQTAFMGTHGSGGLQGGHHALARVQASGLLDVLASPYAYGNRNLRDGLLIEHLPLRSVQAHGLHAYQENDLWTFDNPMVLASEMSFGFTATRQESIAQQRRALAQALCRGTSYWWTELRNPGIDPYIGNFSDPGLLFELGLHQRLFEQWAGRFPRRRPADAEIALIVDEESVDALGLGSKLFLREIYAQLPKWAWCGAPFGVWLASDAGDESLRACRLAYVFAPYMKEERRALLARALCNSGRTVWWGPSTGRWTDRGNDAGTFEALTGFGDAAVPAGMPRERARDGWRSLYGPCAGLTAAQLTEIARNAGVRLYAERPIEVTVSDGMIAVHVAEAGHYALRLPPPGEWRDLFTGRKTQDGGFDFPEVGVALFVRDRER
jgi:hypothetical protein